MQRAPEGHLQASRIQARAGGGGMDTSPAHVAPRLPATPGEGNLTPGSSPRTEGRPHQEGVSMAASGSAGRGI